MKIHGLADGTPVSLREPTMEDIERLQRFYGTLSPMDRFYLRCDMTQRERVQHRIQQNDSGNVCRINAFAGEDIIGDAALEIHGAPWRKRLAEVRVMVQSYYRRLGLGALLAKEVFRLAQEGEIEEIVVRIATDQSSARKIFDRLGFHVDRVLADHMLDPTGKSHSVVLMRCTIDDVWLALHDFYESCDWPDG
jgi:RimJ/RimL family protein N-acetyltransferase